MSDKVKIVLKGTMKGSPRKGNGVVFSDFYNDIGNKYDLIAFDFTPHVQDLMLNANVEGVDVEVYGKLVKRQRGLGIYVDNLYIIDDSAQQAWTDAKEQEPVTVDIPIPEYF